MSLSVSVYVCVSISRPLSRLANANHLIVQALCYRRSTAIHVVARTLHSNSLLERRQLKKRFC